MVISIFVTWMRWKFFFVSLLISNSCSTRSKHPCGNTQKFDSISTYVDDDDDDLN